MTVDSDVVGAAALATHAQVNALISVLVEKHLLTHFEADRVMKLALDTLHSDAVVRTTNPRRLGHARKLLEHTRSVMRENTNIEPFKL